MRGFFAAGAMIATTGTAGTSQAAVTISTAATSNMSCVSGVCTPTAANAVLNVSDLTTMLGSGNVTVNTGSGSLAAEVEDILVSASFNWASASSLTLDAYRSVTYQSAVTNNGAGAVSLITNDGGSRGALSFGTAGSLSFLDTSNSLSINGATYTLVADVHTLANDVTANPSGYYALASNYDASKDGTYSNSPIPSAGGTIEGLGNTISNLIVSLPGKGNSRIGLGFIGSFSGSLSSLSLSSLKISTQRRPLCAVGGLVGSNSGILYDDHTSGLVSNISHAEEMGGGIAPADGLAGFNQGTVQSSSSSVRVTGYTAGGLVGLNEEGTITLSHATGDVSSSDPPGTRGDSVSVGGLVGFSDNNGLVTQSFATGNVDGRDGYDAGGLAGYNEADNGVTSTISNSYATGKVEQADFVGGVSGYNGSDSEPSIVEYSYSTGTVMDGNYVGGLLGRAATTMTNNYWDTNTSKTKNGVGDGNAPGVTGLTSKQLKSGLPTGFDPTIWAENPSVNKGFPYLINNPPPQ
jgi:hypothetical protein